MHAEYVDLVKNPRVEKVLGNCRYHSPLLNLVFDLKTALLGTIPLNKGHLIDTDVD